MIELVATDVTLGFGSKTVVECASLDIRPNEITALIGPNGSGKSTLVSALAGHMPVRSGSIMLNGVEVSRWPRRKLARMLALLPQQPRAPEEILVRQMVAHGRFAHRHPLARLKPEDHRQIDRALEQTQTTDLADRIVTELSGGERQRVWVAMALAQKPQLLILDEPISFLDPGFQFQVLDLLRKLNRDEDLGILMVLHDINHASFYADRIVALRSGRIIADGTPGDVVTPEKVLDLYGISVRNFKSVHTGRPFCIPAHL